MSLVLSTLAATGAVHLVGDRALEKDAWGRRPDPGAVAELVRRYHFVVRRVVLNIVRRLRIPERIDAEEIVSDLYETFVRALLRFDPAKGYRPETYLDRRIRGATLDWLRSRRAADERARAAEREFRTRPRADTSRRAAVARSEATVRTPASLHQPAVGATVARPIELWETIATANGHSRVEVLDELRWCRAQLRERDWQVVELIALRGLDYEEAADALRLSHFHVKSLYQQAMAALRAAAEEAGRG